MLSNLKERLRRKLRLCLVKKLDKGKKGKRERKIKKKVKLMFS
jgi:hypothetical protein